MGKIIDIDEIEIYTTLTFSNDDITVIVKNVLLDDLEYFSDKEKVINCLMYYMWFMHGVYENVIIDNLGIEVTILSRTKKKIELMIKR